MATPPILALGDASYGALLDDSEVLAIVSNYKRSIAGRYRALTRHQLDKIAGMPISASRKYDGELWFLVSKDGIQYLTNPKGKTITGVLPILAEANTLPDGVIIAGELFAHTAGKRERVGELRSVLAEGDKTDTSKIRFAAFDVVGNGAAEIPKQYSDRYQLLRELISESDNLFTVANEICETKSELANLFDRFVEEGASEGLVIRAANDLVYKLKPEIDLDAVVLAYTTRVAAPEVRSLLLGLAEDEERFQIIGAVSTAQHPEREALYQTLSALDVESSVRRASSGGGLYRFVQPKIAVKISCTDLQADASDGTNVKQLLINYGNMSWSKIRMTDCPALLHPVLEGVREDKTVSPLETGLAQLTDYISDAIDNNGDSAESDLEPSRIIRRQVWTKETKGVLAVRKLVVWKTNKETTDPVFPGYVVHWTDFSSSRASPLNREVKPAPSEAIATEIADALVEKHIKKGWDLIE